MGALVDIDIGALVDIDKLTITMHDDQIPLLTNSKQLYHTYSDTTTTYSDHIHYLFKTPRTETEDQYSTLSRYRNLNSHKGSSGTDKHLLLS